MTNANFEIIDSQMDYLCELPNDAARRKALKDLPRGLKLTYERILERVNESNEETQNLVQRTLRRIAHHPSLTKKQLCEVLSINLRDKRKDLEVVPEEIEIYRSCSSLVRMSVDEFRFEFAHLTVEESLKNLGNTPDDTFGAYQIYSKSVENELAKIWYTYLNLEDFDQGGNASEETTIKRFKQYPFREFAVGNSYVLAASADWNDAESFPLASNLFHPSKPGALISWAQDLLPRNLYLNTDKDLYVEKKVEEDLAIFNRGLAEATALHFAAMEGLSEICGWLIEKGSDANRRSRFGTPLHCALLSKWALLAYTPGIHRYNSVGTREFTNTINLLLEAGADVKADYGDRGGGSLFLLMEDYRKCDPDLVQNFFEKGAVIDNSIVDELGYNVRREGRYEALGCILENAAGAVLCDENRAKMVQYALEAKRPTSAWLLPNEPRLDRDQSDWKRRDEASLRTVANFG